MQTSFVSPLVLMLVMAPVVATAAQPPQPPEGFVSVDKLPAQEPFPAAPLLISAYVFVVVILFVYLLSLARRLSAVQRDLERLETDMKKGTRA